MSAEYCHQRARELLTRLGLTAPPVDVQAVAGELGLTVHQVRLPAGMNGRLLRERMIIEVSETIPKNRRRFTIAHEIGHYELGHNPRFCAFDDRSTADPAQVNERQANAFGSELLMPEPWVRERWRQLRTIPAMAEAFGVSEEAMYYQLAGLDLLGLPPVR